eukprot:4014207-Alexandrium_andersonii.AAC.1
MCIRDSPSAAAEPPPGNGHEPSVILEPHSPDSAHNQLPILLKPPRCTGLLDEPRGELGIPAVVGRPVSGRPRA